MVAMIAVALTCLVAVSQAVDTTFYAPPPGSPQELMAKQMYFEESSKILVGLQQAYQWMNFGQIEAYKAYKSGLFEETAGQGHPFVLEEEAHSDGKAMHVPAVPQNKALGEYLKHNEKQLEEQFVTDDTSLEMLSSQSKIAALKVMQVQLYLGAGDVQKSYWTTKIAQLGAPAQLAYFSVFKGFLNTVALSVLMQLHDSFTFEAYMDNFNDDFNAEGTMPEAAFSEAAAEYNVYSSWTGMAGIKMALLYIDYAEASTTAQAMRAAGMSMSAMMPPTAAAPAPAGAQPVEGAQSLLEVELKTGADAGFASADPAQAFQTYITLQYYVSLLKYYNLMVEFQLAHTGSVCASYKLMALRMLTDGNTGNDDSAEKLVDHAEILEGIWLPQMYYQWAQIGFFTYMMDAYLMYTKLTITTSMTQLSAFMASGSDLSAQMQSVEAQNAMESMNF